VIGFLARICPEKGLHLLVEAFKRLVDDAGPSRVRLAVGGYLGNRDRTYLDGIMDQLRAWGLEAAVDYRGELTREQKVAFLDSIHALSVPTVYREPKGRFVLEALAAGVPVVQPRHGAFPELIEATGGGLLVEPASPRALADGLQSLMSDPGHRSEMGERGREAVRRRFGTATMAARTLEVYRHALDHPS
jgi:glycosyltransferase involved in cell wall biosynthesis